MTWFEKNFKEIEIQRKTRDEIEFKHTNEHTEEDWKIVASFLRQLGDDADGYVHRLIVDEDNIEKVEILFKSFDDLEIEESDFQNGSGILEAIAHVLR